VYVMTNGTYRVEYAVAAPGLYDFVVQQVSTGYFLGSDAAKFGLFPSLVDGFRRNYVTPFSVQIRKVGVSANLSRTDVQTAGPYYFEKWAWQGGH